jgi:hypothetical protein
MGYAGQERGHILPERKRVFLSILKETRNNRFLNDMIYCHYSQTSATDGEKNFKILYNI